MTRKYALLLFIFLLISSLGVAFNCRQAKAAVTIYIRADGSISPPTVPISSLDNITYQITGNINGSIIVERSNILIDGAGHTILGAGTGTGFSLNSVGNVSIRNATVSGFYHGIFLGTAFQCTIEGNSITANNYDGIRLFGSSGNNISNNYVASNGNDGIKLFSNSSSNVISENIITENVDDGIQLSGDSNIVSACNVTHNVNLGVYAVNASKIEISSNNLISNFWGLGVYSCEVAWISSNNIEGNNFHGIYLEYSSGVSITNGNITGNYHGVRTYYCSGTRILSSKIRTNAAYGVWLDHSSDGTIEDNTIAENGAIGIYARYGRTNTIQRNNIGSNRDGISFSGTSNNTVCGNNITNSQNGMLFAYNSKDIVVYCNNFLNNTQQANSSTTANVWNTEAEGNYWSDYFGVDQNMDGIGDSPRVIDSNNMDHFPLMGMFHTFNTSKGVWVNVISNSSTAGFQVSESMPNVSVKIQVSNMTSAQTYGFCRVSIPHLLMKGPFEAVVNGTAPYFANYTLYANATRKWVYVSHQHSTLEFVIQGLESTPPNVHMISPENTTYPVPDIPLTFAVDEATSWIGYSLDSQANVTISGNATLTGLGDGVHRIVVYANDSVGNMGMSSTVHFTVDTAPPIISIISPENIVYGSDQVPLTFRISEAYSWIGYSLNDQANATITGNTTLGGLIDGAYTVAVYANDSVGNMGSSDTVYFTVFTPAPSIHILSPENKSYAVTSLPLTFTVDEAVNYMSYSLDGLANMTIFGNITLEAFSEGRHRVVVYANDTDGNMGISSTTYFTIDLSPPDIAAVYQLPIPSNVLPEDTVKVNATAIDNLGQVKRVVLNYTTDNLTWFATDMTRLGGSTWNGTIPSFPLGTSLTYVVMAEDDVNNTISTADLGYKYEYEVVPEYALFALILLWAATSLLLSEATKRKRDRGRLQSLNPASV